MKRRWKIVAGLAVLTIVGLWVVSRPSGAVRDLQDTQRSLREQGFKLELGEFDLSVPPEVSRRVALLGRTTRAALTNRMRLDPMLGGMRDFPELITILSNSTAIPAWKLKDLRNYRGDALWPELRDTFDESRDSLDAAREAAVSGPIRFEPIGSKHPNALLPYLSDMRNLATTFGVLTALDLHDQDAAGAWTNLLAVTCLATAYEPEPIDVSRLSHFGYVTIAFDSTWSALQARASTEAQLSTLQKRWEALDVWKNLPETAAFARANMAAICEMERQQLSRPGLSIQEMLHYPASARSALVGYWGRLQYRNHGSYEDERALLLYYRDRELELRRAIHATTWAEMRQLPGVTNFVRFPSKNSSGMLSSMNLRQLALGFQGRGVGLLGRAAEAESRRRLAIAALALERYRTRNGSYPGKLGDLVPGMLDAVPIDFMDGQPLRYRLTEDGHFVLYSVGLDCVDDGATMSESAAGETVWAAGATVFGSPDGTDLVWARPASDAEIEEFDTRQKRAKDRLEMNREDDQAQAWWNITTRRQSNVEKALTSQATITNEPVYTGRRLSEILSNRSGTNRPSLTDLLTLKQVVTGAEPESVAFELPIKYTALTNLGELVLCIDRYGPDYEEGWGVGKCECVPAANGDCRLEWSTIYETPGKHALLAGLDLKAGHDEDLFGPAMPFVVTNLCQFTPESATFDRERGGTFYIRLAESNGTCTVELKSPAGERLRTLTGTSTNGSLKIFWDLRDDTGRRCTNDSYDTVFHITLPDSGRSQILRGP